MVIHQIHLNTIWEWEGSVIVPQTMGSKTGESLWPCAVCESRGAAEHAETRRDAKWLASWRAEDDRTSPCLGFRAPAGLSPISPATLSPELVSGSCPLPSPFAVPGAAEKSPHGWTAELARLMRGWTARRRNQLGRRGQLATPAGGCAAATQPAWVAPAVKKWGPEKSRRGTWRRDGVSAVPGPG